VQPTLEQLLTSSATELHPFVAELLKHSPQQPPAATVATAAPAPSSSGNAPTASAAAPAPAPPSTFAATAEDEEQKQKQKQMMEDDFVNSLLADLE
jgi:hypothetical protein